MGRTALKVIVDTNLLVRAVVLDDPEQSRKALETLRTAEAIAVSLSCLCELVWVLRRVYRYSPVAIAFSIEKLVGAGEVLTDRAAAHVGLEFLRNGGDFADGVVAYEGRQLGGEVFVSFDRKAVRLVREQGRRAELL